MRSAPACQFQPRPLASSRQQPHTESLFFMLIQPSHNLPAASFRKSSQASPLFGCRMLAYVAPKQGEDEFIRQCLLNGPNSFRRQNQLGFYEPGDPNQAADPDFTEDTQFDHNHIRWNKVGWGLAAFSPDQPTDKPESNMATTGPPAGFTLNKAAKATFEDIENFSSAAEQAAQRHAPVVMGHLRESRQPGKKSQTHPFQIGPWVFMHQGDLSNQITRELRERVAQYAAENTLKAPEPEGSTDSELLGCYIVHRLTQQYGKPAQIGTDQLVRGFGEALNELIQWPEYKTEADRATSQKRHNQGNEHPGMLNFMLSDGKRLIASACTQGPDSYLQLGTRHMKNGDTEYLLSSFRMQPSSELQTEPIKWQPVPNHHIVLLERQSDNHGKPFVACRLIPIKNIRQHTQETTTTTPAKAHPEKTPLPQTQLHPPSPRPLDIATAAKPSWLRSVFNPILRGLHTIGHLFRRGWQWLLTLVGLGGKSAPKAN